MQLPLLVRVQPRAWVAAAASAVAAVEGDAWAAATGPTRPVRATTKVASKSLKRMGSPGNSLNCCAWRIGRFPIDLMRRRALAGD
jgi:hypothetical protein